jgi:HPt (histidine-containing phosphotransfer) domain-containing protein
VIVEPALVDRAVLDALLADVGGDAEFVAELVQTYLGDAPSNLRDIEAAIAAGDSAALVRPAHTLKSSSASVGAMRLSAIARSLEAAGREGRAVGLEAELATVLAAWPATVVAFREAGITE